MEKNIYFTDYTTGADRNIHKLRKGDIILCDNFLAVVSQETEGIIKQDPTILVIKYGSKHAYEILDSLEGKNIQRYGHSKVFDKKIRDLRNLSTNSYEISDKIAVELFEEIKKVALEHDISEYII